ncbi:GMC family oxidoreductase [Roseateles violae]|uniref:GMC family oxidoreductase n=1 Tax=Roseateles violae TaxID=3058042 RepID=A0ABT8DY86_9BURK|nr:GMC family oxidoreductase [Pelomonas sp. PFR6]MDN3922244.1 GMC family oxidoreductase [Pelomonas sp. PFR6]
MTNNSIPDPIREGLARGWHVFGGAQPAAAPALDCDVAIIGSGAGAGITAELLAKAGLAVVIVEEGPLRSSSDFHQREDQAYSTLYQEAGGRKTADQAMPVLQGRCVGGSTTVNWTGSFRTPADTLAYWARHFGLEDFNPAAMAPWFEQVERRLGIAEWPTAPNENNAVLRRGAAKLGLAAATMQRNVKGCWNLGSCGLGCPTNAKQSMLVTTIPAALDLGARLLVQTRAQKFELKEGAVDALRCQPVALDGAVSGAEIRIRARHYVLAGGAINSPALLLRSGAPDPHGLLGRRTFLHPTVASHALFEQPVQGWAGAPLSVYSDHFLRTQPVDGPIGYKLEVAPVHPAFALTNLGGLGATLAERARSLPNAQLMIGLLRDGFHAESPGGSVALRGDGSPQLHYALNDYLLSGVRRAYLSMAEIQFAAGAQSVRPVHEQAADYKSWQEARAGIARLDMRPYLATVGSAHVMGGCNLAADSARGVVRPDGRHWQLANLSVHDGSLFPTSIGANPQLSVYGMAARLASGLARELSGRSVTLA